MDTVSVTFFYEPSVKSAHSYIYLYLKSGTKLSLKVIEDYYILSIKIESKIGC